MNSAPQPSSTPTATSMPLPERLGLEILDGPHRVGSELRWHVRQGDAPAVLAQLLPELARDPSLRRRYVRDLDRVLALTDVALAPTRQRGPQPDPRDENAEPPWRLRDDPPGQTLEDWLTRRAPAPIDEAVSIVADLAERLHPLHAQGAVLRDLNPRLVVRGDDGTLWLTDVGLARVDVLSTRTAASLLLEGSPYSAPELLMHTAVDQRADVYGLGVILYRALTGTLPGGSDQGLLRSSEPPARLRTHRPEIPAALDELVARCLADDPAERPGSAAEIADALRGRIALPDQGERVECQACGEQLRLGQRLCTHCGKLAVQFSPAAEGEEPYDVMLRKIDERAASRVHLRQLLGAVSEGPLPPLNFLVGDQRWYSKEERERLIKLPVRLLSGLSKGDAERLARRLELKHIDTRVVPTNPNGPRELTRKQRGGLAGGVAVGATIGLILWLSMGGIAGMLMGGTIFGLTAVIVYAISRSLRNAKRKSDDQPLAQLRAAPAALAASDPLVARLAAVLDADPPDDLREQIGELALAVQRLVDHRAGHLKGQEIDMVTAPVEQLVALVEQHVAAITTIDQQLTQLDEGTLVRSLAAAEARNDVPAVREELLHGLDRLRSLEEARARRFHALLEATRLAHRALELGLSVADDEAEHNREVAAALEALSRELGEPAPDPGTAAAALGEATERPAIA